jgi:hypothetical protein
VKNEMVGRKKAHINAFLLAMAMTGLVMGIGLPIVTAAPDDHHEYDNWIADTFLGINGVRVTLITDSYKDGLYLTAVHATQDNWIAAWAFTTTVTQRGTEVTDIDDHRKLASGEFYVTVYIVWPFPIDSATGNLYTEVSYYGSGFSYYDYSIWS